jgi:hypothetical protein
MQHTVIVGVVVASAFVGDMVGLSIGALILILVLLAFGAGLLAVRTFRVRRHADIVLVAFTLAGAWTMVTAEALSRLHLLGNRPGWIVGLGILGLLGITCGSVGRPFPARRLTLPASRSTKLALLAAAGLGCLVVAHLAALAPLTGILNPDQLAIYLSRSARYIQDGTFEQYSTGFDYYPPLHETLMLVVMLFTRSDAWIPLISVLFSTATALAIYAYASRIGSAAYGGVAAVMPLAIPLFLLHLSSFNSTIMATAWIALAVYFLDRGYAHTDRRWLVLASVAAGLAVASKATAWFTMPGLILLGALVAWRGFRRRSARAVAATLAICLGSGMLVGGLYLVRNLILLGFLVLPPQSGLESMGSLGIGQRLTLLGFNAYTFGAFTLVPPTAYPLAYEDYYRQYFTEFGQRLGFALPSTYLTFPPQVPWAGVFTFFQPAWAGWSLGLAVPLVVLPSAVVAAVLWVRGGPRRFRLAAPLVAAAAGVAVLCMTMSYHPSHTRYLIEPTGSLLLLGPLWLRAACRYRHAVIGAAVSALVVSLLTWETARVVAVRPEFDAALVSGVPRIEQYARFDNPYRFKYFEAAERLGERYPVSEYPEIAVHVGSLQNPHFLQYPYLTADPKRRVSYWRDTGAGGPTPTIPVVTPLRTVAARFESDRRVYVDPLAPGIWLVVPLTRMAVSWGMDDTPQDGYPVLHVEAHVDPERVRRPQYRFGVAPVYEALGWTADAGWGNEGRVDIRLAEWMVQPTSEDVFVDIRAQVFVEVRSSTNPRRIERRSIPLNRMVYGWDAR